jgi:hypothetical protein
VVEEGKQRAASVHEVGLDAERGEHRRVLTADHAATQDRERRRQPFDPQDVVGVVNVGILERDRRRAERV